ncbi:MAG: 50S ribosomal protein L18 [Candidatus Levybacteria bacterium RIFCSPHIGHO2_01_FULL_36_15]|nr:MAG: 50S ribosomal protein L18 [Candidatus Levybacteria bacterium RIFCSPHIGHO2_01_FULL_36_15]OGH38369.1 MAG: 50S ribosomal protein L18 [Candidatus Levybacteria bacterium RIFCSPLOWO2_01_FULL_36_10]
MKRVKIKKDRKITRQKRTRMKLLENTRKSERPRLSVFRSNKYFYAQIIDDAKGATLVSADVKEIKDDKITKTSQAVEIGRIIAKRAIEKNIKEVVFDKGAYKYHGRVKAFAVSAREGGLDF